MNKENNVKFYIGDEMFQNQLNCSELSQLEAKLKAKLPLIFFKHIFDVLISGIALLVFLPFFLIFSVMIYIENPGVSPIFMQNRVGRNGKIFRIYKFCTMYANVPPNLPTNSLGDSENMVTRLGKILRKYSLDELPQLFNVLNGKMSLVGPRPLIPEEKEIHIARLRGGAYLVKPGLTGLAQIKGRDLVASYEKAYWDIKYVEQFSFKQDLNILIKTIPKVLKVGGFHDGNITLYSNRNNSK